MNTRPQEDDRPLLKTLVERLQRELVHVALIGHDTAIVDEQGRRLVHSLRQDAGLEVVALFDAQDEVLIGRVNQRLASLSLAQARQAQSAPQPLQVWVLQVQTDAQSRQAQMLARMLSDFPAVNLRLILLVSPVLAEALLESSVGRVFLPWRLPGSALVALDEEDLLPEPEPRLQAPPPSQPGSEPRPSLLARMQARLRYPPHPGMVAAIAITLLLVSLLVRCR
jgi:hypothetical protein